MKKKGLIISTVVMVVVLIASLTTATYAWFTTSAKTTIEGFNLEVVSNSAVRIGLRQSIEAGTDFQSTDGENLFINGSTKFVGDAGKLTGHWDDASATPGLGTEIAHDIAFGGVKKAVGVTTEAITGENISLTSAQTTGFIGYNRSTSNIFKANGKDSKDATPLDLVEPAVVNGSETDSKDGDLAYLWLGITPSGALQENTNKLYIIVQSDGASVGLGAAIHVAYRLYNPTDTAAAAWKDEDVFGDKGQATPKASAVVNKYSETNTNGIPVAVWDMIPAESKTGDTLVGAAVLVIDLNNYTKDQITQLEMVIYVSGKDTDCINSAVKNVGVSIGMYFGAQLLQTT